MGAFKVLYEVTVEKAHCNSMGNSLMLNWLVQQRPKRFKVLVL